MANAKNKQHDAEVEKHLHCVSQQLVAANGKLDLLLENAGMGEQLRVLAEKLRVSNERLEADVKANQP